MGNLKSCSLSQISPEKRSKNAEHEDSHSKRHTRASGTLQPLEQLIDIQRPRRPSRRDDDHLVDSEPENQKKYPFRDRSRHRRETLNVSHLGGEGQSYLLGDHEVEEEEEVQQEDIEVEQEEKDEDQDQDDDDDEDEYDEEGNKKKYSFRDRSRHRRETLNVTHLGGEGQSYVKSTTFRVPPHRSIYRDSSRVYLGGRISTEKKPNREKRHRETHKRRHFDSSSESSSSSSSSHHHSKRRAHGSRGEEDRQFLDHEEERLRKELASIVPLSSSMGGSMRDKVSRRDISRADVTPITVDSSIGFSSVGGLDRHVRALKEMVVLPLLYPDVFKRFDTQPPRGVLFVGPPGTGKRN